MSEVKQTQDGHVISHVIVPNDGRYDVDDEWCIYCSDEIAPGMIYCTFCGYKFTASQLAEVEDD